MNIFRHFRPFGWALCVLAGFGVAGPAFAQAGGGLQINSAVYQDIEVKADDGSVKTSRVPANTVVPGTEVIYQISYRNAGGQAATDIAINNPVPKELAFTGVDGLAATAFSVDDGAHFGNLQELSVPKADGGKRPATAADVTNVRWILATLAPGEKGSVSFRARVK